MNPDRTGRSRATLAAADFVAINIGFAIAYLLRYSAEIGGDIAWYNYVPYREYMPWGIALSLILFVIFTIDGLYGRSRRSFLDNLYTLLTSTIVGVAILTVLIFGLRPLAQSRLMLIYAAVLIVVCTGTIRLIDAYLFRRRLKRGTGITHTVIVGAGEVGRAVMRNIIAEPDMGLRVVGFLDDDPEKQAEPIGRFEPLGGTESLQDVLQTHRIDGAILALPWQSREKIIQLVDQCEAAGVRARIVPDLFQMSLNRVDIGSLNGIPLIDVRAPIIRGWSRRAKRAMDVGIAAAMFVIASPLLAIIAIAIRLETPGPVLYRQPRLGREGRLFTLYKFRSMREGADLERPSLLDLNEAIGPIFKMRNDPRLTNVGRTIRRLSLDELPQLWNVLLGDMSLVGPRPPMPVEVSQYKDWHRSRLDIAPGLTGLWQVSGRSKLTFDEMVMLDLFYAENWSLGLDLKILLRTVPTVIVGTGAY